MPVEDRETKDHRTEEDPTEDPEEPVGPEGSPPIETSADVEGIRPSLHRSTNGPKGEEWKAYHGTDEEEYPSMHREKTRRKENADNRSLSEI